MRRERSALRGCPVGRLTMDPDVMADPELRRPVEAAFAAVRHRLAERDGHPVRELGPGDVFFESAGEPIRRFDDLSDSDPATFIAFYLLSGDQPLIQPIQ